jgi:hypothetical protein
VWWVVQVTLVGLSVAALGLMVRRLRPVATAAVVLTGLTVVVALSLTAMSPWPRLSVPALAAHMEAGEKAPLPKDAADRLLVAEILEVHVWDGIHAVVIAREETKGAKAATWICVG